MTDPRKFDYGVWWSDEDQCFIARAMTLEAGTGYGDSPEAALTDAIAFAQANDEIGYGPVAFPLSAPGVDAWSAEAIRDLRASLSLTQAQLAEMMNVSTRAVTNWEQGQNNPDGASRRLLDIFAANPGAAFRWLWARDPARTSA